MHLKRYFSVWYVTAVNNEVLSVISATFWDYSKECKQPISPKKSTVTTIRDTTERMATENMPIRIVIGRHKETEQEVPFQDEEVHTVSIK